MIAAINACLLCLCLCFVQAQAQAQVQVLHFTEIEPIAEIDSIEEIQPIREIQPISESLVVKVESQSEPVVAEFTNEAFISIGHADPEDFEYVHKNDVESQSEPVVAEFTNEAFISIGHADPEDFEYVHKNDAGWPFFALFFALAGCLCVGIILVKVIWWAGVQRGRQEVAQARDQQISRFILDLSTECKRAQKLNDPCRWRDYEIACFTAKCLSIAIRNAIWTDTKAIAEAKKAISLHCWPSDLSKEIAPFQIDANVDLSEEVTKEL